MSNHEFHTFFFIYAFEIMYAIFRHFMCQIIYFHVMNQCYECIRNTEGWLNESMLWVGE